MKLTISNELAKLFKKNTLPVEKVELPYGSQFCCPTCKTDPPDRDYTVKGKKYPRCVNAHSGFNGDYDYNDWDEIHYCRKCKIEYYFTNGSH
jgi:hypothetical protein